MPKRTRSGGHRPRDHHRRKRRRTGRQARAGRQTLRSEKIGALPIINHFISRLRLEERLGEHLPPEDKRVKVPAAKALLVLLRNLLISREPLYGMGEWAAGYAPDLLGLTLDELEALFFGVGQALGPFVGGFIADKTGSFTTSFMLSGAVSLLGTVLAVRLKSKGDDG